MALLDALIGGGSSLFGLLSAADARRRAEAAQRQALNDLAAQNDALYQGALGYNHQSLMQMAGLGGDAVSALGRGLGDVYAQAGLYNPSAVGGAINQAALNQQTQLANAASQMQAEAWRQRQAGIMDIGRLRLGQAQDQYNQAVGNYQQGIGGLQSFLGNMVQSNLFSSGANRGRTALPPVNGTINQGINLPGNLGSFGSGTTAQMAGLGGNPLGQYSGLVPPPALARFRVPGI